MILLPIFTAVILVVLLVIVITRALDYLRYHPELVTNGTPLAYQLCQITLRQVIERYKQIEKESGEPVNVSWQSPNGYRYTVNKRGIEERYADLPEGRGVTFLAWDDVGGVGVRMQPGFTLAGSRRESWVENQYTSGYTFHLLIVPISGATMNIRIPTDDRPEAVEFAAHTIALAEQQQKRINVFGFDKPPAPYKQRVSKI
ncbi:MAG: hypothetical protein HY866_06810 [Chloroflexi bacterium]|nr:hypothetical protein [Chloroflexota bacterium]